MKLFKVIFTILLFTLTLESIEGRIVTVTDAIDEYKVGSTTICRDGCIREIEYFDDGVRLSQRNITIWRWGNKYNDDELPSSKILEFNTKADFWYKYYELKLINGVHYRTFYHENGNIWVRNEEKTIFDESEEFCGSKVCDTVTRNECFDDNGKSLIGFHFITVFGDTIKNYKCQPIKITDKDIKAFRKKTERGNIKQLLRTFQYNDLLRSLESDGYTIHKYLE